MLVDVLSALALVFVFEGIVPFAAPTRWKQWLRRVIDQDDMVLRMTGFFSMIVGVVLLIIVHQFAE